MKIESRKPCIDEPVPRAGTDTHVENMRVDTAAGTTGRAALTRAHARIQFRRHGVFMVFLHRLGLDWHL